MTATHICMLNDEHYPLKEADTINVVRTASGLGQAGARVDLVVPRLWGRNATAEELGAHYGVPATFNLIRVPTLFPTLRSLRVEKLTHPVLAPWLGHLVRADVIYSRNLLPLALAHALGVPWVFETYRRLAEQIPLLRLLGPRLPLRRALAAVAHAERCAENLVQIGFERDAVLTAYSGYLPAEVEPPLDRETARRVCGLELDGKVVLYLGNADPYIRLDWLLDVAGHLPDVTFVFVGGYRAQHDTWRRYGRRRGLGNAVFVEHQAPCRVRPFLYTADALAVVPSNVDLEHRRRGLGLYRTLPGIPMKIFIYKATGIPIFAPDLSYMHEVLRRDENAVLGPVDDPPRAARRLRRLLEDRETARRLAAAARADATQHTWAERGARILRFIERRLASAEAGTSPAVAAAVMSGQSSASMWGHQAWRIQPRW
jgi:glycosyltransferase involved in cell wall biosynthesis